MKRKWPQQKSSQEEQGTLTRKSSPHASFSLQPTQPPHKKSCYRFLGHRQERADPSLWKSYELNTTSATWSPQLVRFKFLDSCRPVLQQQLSQIRRHFQTFLETGYLQLQWDLRTPVDALKMISRMEQDTDSLWPPTESSSLSFQQTLELPTSPLQKSSTGSKKCLSKST